MNGPSPESMIDGRSKRRQLSMFNQYFDRLLLQILQKDIVVESNYFDTNFEFELLWIHIFLLGFNDLNVILPNLTWTSFTQIWRFIRTPSNLCDVIYEWSLRGSCTLEKIDPFPGKVRADTYED